MIRIAICDDIASELENIHDMVLQFTKKTPETDFYVRCYHSAYDLLTAVENGSRFEIYLLDIVMPQISGIDIGESIRKKDDLAVIIYLTSSQEYALESYSVFAFQYLVKPVPGPALIAVLKKALLKIGLENSQIFPIKTKEGISAVHYNEILYVEYKSHSLLFYLSDGSTLGTVSTREPFECAVKELLADNRFVRPHASFVVNMSHVRAITGKEFVMTSRACVAISQKNYKEVKNQYIDYLLEKGESFKC